VQFFTEIKRSFEIIFSDRGWLLKLFLAGVLLINPVLIISALEGNSPLLFWMMGVNALTFWLPLGYMMEVLRRARQGTIANLGLPSWEIKYWSGYLRDGAAKFFIAIFTLILPSAAWIVLCSVLFKGIQQPALAGMAAPFVFFFTVPLCAVACCRWLDGGDLMSAALDYRANFDFYRLRWSEYSIATLILLGLNTLGNSFILTLPLITVFGLCLVDTWFGPIYADSAKEVEQAG
jgi:uncharacterized protein DUF4013